MRRILLVGALLATLFTFIPVAPAGAVGEPLTGKVTLSGVGVSGIQVIAQLQGQAESYSSTTDANGDYAIAAPDGTYTVQIFSMTYLPIPPQTVVLDALNPQVLNITLFAPPPPPPPPASFSVTGRLVDNTGVGTAGTITATAVTPFGPPSPTPPIVQSTLADGTFTIVLAGGNWRISASSPGLVGVDRQVSSAIDLGDIVLLPAAIVTGTVRDSANNPIAGAQVTAFGLSPTTVPPALTDSNGSYTLVLGSTAASWTVTATKSDFAFEQNGPSSLYPIGVTTKNFVLLRPGRVSGQVLSPAGSPASGTTIQLQSTTAGGTGFVKPTDVNGEYFFDVRPGDYTLNVIAGALVQPVTIPVTITEQGSITRDVQLLTASSVALRTSSGPLAPVGNTGIAVCPAPGVATTTVNVCSNGAAWSSFAFANPGGVAALGALAPGNYNVTGLIDFAGPGFTQSAALPITIIGTETLTCTLYVDASSPSGCTGGTPPDTDGVDAAVEDAGPYGGDGNGDGDADSAQAHVASTPDPTTGGYVTIAAPSDQYPLSKVTTTDPATLAPPPPTVTGESAVIGFEVAVPTPGETVTIDIYLDDPLGEIDGYWKYDTVAGTWSDATTLATFAAVGDGRTKVTLTLTDGGDGDQDGMTDGVIVDPAMFTSRSPYTVRVLSPALSPTLLRSARVNTTVGFVFQVRDATGQPVTGNVVTAPRSVRVDCPPRLAVPVLSLAFLPAVTSTSGLGNWYAGWRATAEMKGTCQSVSIDLDDGTTLRYIIKVI